MRIILSITTILLVHAAYSANNTLEDKILDGHGKPFVTPRGNNATLEDLGLGTVPRGNNPPVRVVPWSTMPGEKSQMAYVGDRLFFSTVKGKIWEYTRQGKRIKPEFLDVKLYRSAFSINASYSGKGLRGFAFHPDFSQNGLLYTMHLELNAGEKATHGEITASAQYVLGEWQFDLARKKPPTFRSVLRVGYSTTEHVGGQIGFNPVAKKGHADYGNLYAGFGDGGGPCAWSDACIDQFHFGQDFSTIQSSIIRINPLQSGKLPYSIPADNPFVSNHDSKNIIADEIFAKGFRNPSTLTFNLKTGQLYVGDISQNSIEEINLIEKGGNYGWGVQEGTWLFTDLTDTDNKLRYIPLGNGSDVTAHTATYTGKDRKGSPLIHKNISRLTDGFTSPVAQFSHRQNSGIAAVVTGAAYQGSAVPELKGLFLFANLSRDKIYYARQNELVNDEMPAQVFELNLLNENGRPSSLAAIVIGNDPLNKNFEPYLAESRTDIRFGQDQAGEIYFASKHNNVIYRLQSP
jgi:hypothetical protein